MLETSKRLPTPPTVPVPRPMIISLRTEPLTADVLAGHLVQDAGISAALQRNWRCHGCCRPRPNFRIVPGGKDLDSTKKQVHEFKQVRTWVNNIATKLTENKRVMKQHRPHISTGIEFELLQLDNEVYTDELLGALSSLDSLENKTTRTRCAVCGWANK